MKYLEKFDTYHYFDIKEMIESLRDLSLELSDNNISFNISPNNDILIKVLSLHFRKLLDVDTKVLQPKFSMTIYINEELKNKKNLFESPDWFKDFFYRLESMMNVYNFSCLYSVSYPGGKVKSLQSIEELIGLNSLEDAIIIDFKLKEKN